MSGKLYALGVGPGGSDLLTVRAARLLGQLDVLYAPAGRKGGDSLALAIVREYLLPHTEIRTCHFPMSADDAQKQAAWDDVAQQLKAEVARGKHFPMSADDAQKQAAWDDVAQQLKAEVARGKQVGFITLGDAMLFSTWVFLLARLGRPAWLEIVPGVTSFAAIAARAALPLAMETQSLAVMSCTAAEAELEQALLTHDCVVLMKVYGRFASIQSLLARLKLFDHALLMAEATQPGEQCWRRLDQLPADRPLPYFSTILVNKRWFTEE